MHRCWASPSRKYSSWRGVPPVPAPEMFISTVRRHIMASPTQNVSEKPRKGSKSGRNQGCGRISPNCALSKFDTGNGAKGIPPYPRIPACSFVQLRTLGGGNGSQAFCPFVVVFGNPPFNQLTGTPKKEPDNLVAPSRFLFVLFFKLFSFWCLVVFHSTH